MGRKLGGPGNRGGSKTYSGEGEKRNVPHNPGTTPKNLTKQTTPGNLAKPIPAQGSGEHHPPGPAGTMLTPAQTNPMITNQRRQPYNGPLALHPNLQQPDPMIKPYYVPGYSGGTIISNTGDPKNPGGSAEKFGMKGKAPGNYPKSFKGKGRNK